MLIAAIVLYRNLALFTSLTTDDLRIGIFRVTTLCNISILIIGIVFAFSELQLMSITFSENWRETICYGIIVLHNGFYRYCIAEVAI